MNVCKLQQDILKTLVDEKLKMKPSKFLCESDDEYVYFVNGVQIFKIKKDECFIDTNKLKNRNMKKLLSNFGYEPDKYADVGYMIEYVKNGTKLTLRKLTLNDISTYVDVKLLKYFDADNMKFYFTSNKDLISVWEHGELIGAVLPVKYDEREVEQ